MTKKAKVLSSSLALSVVFALTGCGGSGSDSGSSTNASSTTGTGYYLDSAVSGVNYVCGSQKGITDTNGTFTFQVGKNCVFKLNDMIVKKIPANNLNDGIKVVEDNTTVARFLQTLDIDGDATNGIEITKEVVKALRDTKISNLPVNDSQLSAMFTSVKNEVKNYKGAVVSVYDAEKHLNDTLTKVTKSLLSGKTFYMVWNDKNDNDYGLDKVVFNNPVTEVIQDSLKNNTNHEIKTPTVKEGKLVWNDDSYSVITKVTSSYIVFTDYDKDGKVSGTDYAYYSQSEAEAAYDKKYTPVVVVPAPTPSASTNTDSTQPIVPYTQSKSAPAGGKTITIKLGADGQLKATSVMGYPVLKLAGTNDITVSQIIRTVYSTGTFAAEGDGAATVTQDFVKGTEHIVSTSSTYGHADCVNVYRSPLPITLTTNSQFDFDFERSSRLSTTCPDWVNADAKGEPEEFTSTANTTITSSSNSVSHISQYMNIK